MRDTKRKRAILELLEVHGEWEYQEYGTPPYNAALIAERIGASAQSVARTLRNMAATGAVVPVRVRKEIWNAIAQDSIDRTVTAYFSARTMRYDEAAAKAWRDGSDARSTEAFANMFGTRGEASVSPPVLLR